MNTKAWPPPSQQMAWLARATGPQLSDPEAMPSKHRRSPAPNWELPNFALTARWLVSGR